MLHEGKIGFGLRREFAVSAEAIVVFMNSAGSERGELKQEFGSISIVFPDPNFEQWVDTPVCLTEIRDLQEIGARSAIDQTQASHQQVEPTLKPGVKQARRLEDAS
ncbi:hypothetical protein KT71_001390 [Congregibacter litoralis KT71]|uniref:Uncharacterized protein n=1 Tax=Congregibacter litoralis KT71 TaxID=314285 RepID=V7HSW6_9GAMM|nr:hypothetical protein [Congregibacter litoralis]ESZ89321.1 hypothetical protein KT71_001390 [Congregibacter litoralis KT71]